MKILTSNSLRRITQPLRARAPGLYESANRFRKRLLRGGSDLKAYQSVALGSFKRRCLGDAAGKRVLEIGSDLDFRVLREFERLGVGFVAGVNNLDAFWEKQPGDSIRVSERAELFNADANTLPFEDAAFDHVFSVACLEHLDDLAGALREMNRVLKPAGSIYAHFGPIWSGGKGHHVFAQAGGGEGHHFNPLGALLPDHFHLLMGPDELRRSLAGRGDDALVERTVRQVYERRGLNRLLYHDYLRIFEESGLRVVSLVQERDPVDEQLDQILRLRYPGENAFDVTNVEVVLARPGRT